MRAGVSGLASLVLDAEREKRVAELFRKALDVAPAARAAFVEAHDGGDPEIRARLAELLAEEERGTKGLLAKDPFGERAPEERRIGPYRLLEVLGEGGMGTVHLADQTEPVRRRVALKTIRLGMASGEVLARFAGERHALARMNHPNIAEIHDAGSTESGLPWFAMEYCPGPPLDVYGDRARLTIEERIGLFLPVCDAVQHAHQKGVIHRDLKPANVLVPLRDGRPVPKVIDFGVARAVAGESLAAPYHTVFGKLVGTWRYMSPEQADPKGEVDTRTDVWALGAILYEILTGGPPFREDSVTGIVTALANEDPQSPSRRIRSLSAPEREGVARARRTTTEALARRVGGDLDAIALKALERDRTRRYAAASELAADLRRHLANEPVTARTPTLAYQARKFVRRNRTAVSLLAGSVLAVVAALALAWQEARRARDAEHERVELGRRSLDESFARSRFLEHAFFVGGDRPLSALLEGAEADLPRLYGGRPGEEAAVRYALGAAWLDLGRPEKARPHLERAYALLTRTLGRESVEVFLALDALIRAARQGGREPDRGVVEHSLALAARLAGEEDPELGRALRDMVDMGATPSSEEAAARLAAVSTKFGSVSRRREASLFVARVLAETAVTFLEHGRAAESASYSRAVEGLAEEVLEAGSTERFLFFLRFARVLLAAGPPLAEHAVEIAARLLAETEKGLPEDHWLRLEAKAIHGEASGLAPSPGR